MLGIGSLNSFGLVEFPKLVQLNTGLFEGTAGWPGAALSFPLLGAISTATFRDTGDILLPSLRSGWLTYERTGSVSLPRFQLGSLTFSYVVAALDFDFVALTASLSFASSGPVFFPNLTRMIGQLTIVNSSVHFPRLSEITGYISISGLRQSISFPELVIAGTRLSLSSSTIDTLDLGFVRNWSTSNYIFYLDGPVIIQHLNLSSLNMSIQYLQYVSCAGGSSFNVSRVTKPAGSISVAYCQASCTQATWSPEVRGLFVARGSPPCP